MKRGRKSSAELATPGAVLAVPRLPVPAALGTLAAGVWQRTVESLPAEWFSLADAPALTAYCRHVTRCDELEALLAAVDPTEDLGRYAELVRLIAIESGQVLRLARALRLVPSARTHQVTAARALARDVPRAVGRPWARREA